MNTIKNVEWIKVSEDHFPITLHPGDTINLIYDDPSGKSTTVISEQLKESYIFYEARIFKAEIDGQDALGGVLLGRKKNTDITTIIEERRTIG